MGLYCVYKHTAPSGKVYIGITCRRPEKRWSNGHGYAQNKHFSNAINLYGWENFKHEILAENMSKEDACEMERNLIKKYQSNKTEYGYNRSTGGENPNEGTTASAENLRKKSIALKGRVMPMHDRIAISKAKKGKSNGHEGQTGERCPKSGIVSQVDEKTGKTIAQFFGFPEMSRKTGFKMTPVKEAAAGQRKRAYGFLWRYEKRGVNNVFI